MSALHVVGVTASCQYIEIECSEINLQADRASAGFVSARSQILVPDIVNCFLKVLNNNL